MNKEMEMFKAEGFEGFIRVAELRNNTNVVPSEGGVYIVIRDSRGAPVFLGEGTGTPDERKSEPLNKPIPFLKANYVNESTIVYIGKGDSLSKRIRQLLLFGAGKYRGHWGGRILWQLADAEELLIAWRITSGLNPRDVEKMMFREYENKYGRLPYANLMH